MLTINVLGREGEKFLNGSLSGEKFNLPFTEDLFEGLKTLQSEYNAFEDAASIPEWEDRVKALFVEKEMDIIETSCPDLQKDHRTGNYYVTIDGDVSKTPVPENLVDVMLESAEKGISPEPIVKAWIRFLRNPNFTEHKAYKFAEYITAQIVDGEEVDRLMSEEGFTEERAVDRATYNDVAITQEGLIVTKKYAQLLTEGWKIDTETNKPVRIPLYPQSAKEVDLITGDVTGGEDVLPEFSEELYFEPPVMGTGGNEFFCGDKPGHVIRVGQKHTLADWSMVNTNDNNSCVPGLHVGGWKYVASYKGLNCQLLECFVDPAEIGAIVGVGNGGDGAIRVREYFIYGAVQGRTKGIYHSSNYAKMKDVEWEEYKKLAVKEANELLDAIQVSLDTLGK